MKSTDWTDIKRDKDVIRRRESERPYGEKLDQLDRLRERSGVLRSVRERDSAGSSRQPAPARKK